MPNGGYMPSCAMCKFGDAEHIDHRIFRTTPLNCSRHKMAIYDPLNTFCHELTASQRIIDSESDYFAKLVSNFTEQNSAALLPDTIYLWLQAYSDGYIHEFVKLTTASDYATWSREKELEVGRSLGAEWRNRREAKDD